VIAACNARAHLCRPAAHCNSPGYLAIYLHDRVRVTALDHPHARTQFKKSSLKISPRLKPGTGTCKFWRLFDLHWPIAMFLRHRAMMHRYSRWSQAASHVKLQYEDGSQCAQCCCTNERTEKRVCFSVHQPIYRCSSMFHGSVLADLHTTAVSRGSSSFGRQKKDKYWCSSLRHQDGSCKQR